GARAAARRACRAPRRRGARGACEEGRSQNLEVRRTATRHDCGPFNFSLFSSHFSMGSLSSELAPHAERLAARPRVYADANVPAGIVAHMRTRLGWDVLFVLEEDDLR